MKHNIWGVPREFLKSLNLPGKGMALLPSPSPKNRACGRVGGQRVTRLSTFPTAPLQTARESFDLKSAFQ